MKRLVFFCIAFFCVSATACSQNTITGTFPDLSGQQVKLVGFEGFETYTIDSARVSEKGTFRLSYSTEDYGMGYLAAEDNKAFIVILAAGEDLKLEGEALAFAEIVVITSGKQNQLFEQYSTEHPRREQALSAWDYLERIYSDDPLFLNQDVPIQAIAHEKQRLIKEDKAFLESLDPQSYVSWFLPLRKLVSSVPTIAQYRTVEIPAAIAAFRQMDYTDPRLYKSGLLRETIDAHFWLIENSGRPLDTVFMEINVSIDHLIENLVADEKKFNEITDYLFNLLEQRSLFASSEYLALKVLNEVSCIIDDKLSAQMESYRAMKTGNTAPDILFNGDILKNGVAIIKPGRLSEIESAYTVVVFGSAWCPMCTRELSEIQRVYEKWKARGVEVVYVSLDVDKEDFINHSTQFPFISFSNYKKWETQAVKDYHVFATPTMFLLNKDREILLRPNSVRQMDAWVDWYLTER